jgi:hypothetical protein
MDPSLMLMFAQALQRKPGRAGRAKKNVVFSLDRGQGRGFTRSLLQHNIFRTVTHNCETHCV